MKKIFWTTIFRFVVVLGFMFYMRSFDANMANGVATRLGATNIVAQDTLFTGMTESTDVMSGIAAIQTTLADMQITLNKLAGETTPTVIPTVDTTADTTATVETAE